MDIPNCDVCGKDAFFGEYQGKNYCRNCAIKLVEELI